MLHACVGMRGVSPGVSHMPTQAWSMAPGMAPGPKSVFCYRFFKVMLMPKLSIMINDVSRLGFVVIAFM